MEVVSYVLAGVGILLILLGSGMTYWDWRNRPTIKTDRDALDKNINALTRLLKVLKDYPPGMWLIVIGIVLILIGAAFGGLSKL